MRTQNLHDRPHDVDLTPRWAAAFAFAFGLMVTAYAFIHYVAVKEANAGQHHPAAVRLVQTR